MSYTYKDLLCRSSITLNVVDDIALYKAELMSSNGNIFRRGDKDSQLNIVVFKGAEVITNKFSDIEWKRFSPYSNGEDDKHWGDKFKNKSTITITPKDVEKKAVIQCSVYTTIQEERTLIASQSITFVNVNDFTPTTEPPKNPSDGDIWIDSSIDPPVIKVWNKELGSWIIVTNASTSTKNIINNSNFWKSYSFDDFNIEGNLTNYSIVPYVNKNWASIKSNEHDETVRGISQDINKQVYTGETYLLQLLAKKDDLTELYNGNINVAIKDTIEEEEVIIAEKMFKITSSPEKYYFTFSMPKKVNKLKLYIHGELNKAFHFSFTEISLSHSSRLHDWELSQEDIMNKIEHKVDNNPEAVFNSLTNNGKMQGIYRAKNPNDENKEDYFINASYIKTGVLDSERINAKGLLVEKDVGENKKEPTLEITPEGDVNLIVNKLNIKPSTETNVALQEDLNKKADASKEGIVNALNDTGIFLEDQKLIINADNIKTGSLTSKSNASEFNLDKGTFLLGESDTKFKLKFDGKDLLFGKGSIKWENLDSQLIDELTPYEVYLENPSIIVDEKINESPIEDKPLNRIVAIKGNEKLTAVEKATKKGEFSFEIVEEVNCKAIKNTPDSFYINKVSSSQAHIKIEVFCEDKSSYIKTNTISMPDIKGEQGPPGESGAMAVFLYRKSLEKPPKPIGNNPIKWSSDIENILETGHLWMSQGIVSVDTHELKGEWSDPIKLEKMENNLLSNYNWKPGMESNPNSIYTTLGRISENKIEYGLGPKGQTEALWIAQNAKDGSELWDGGFSAKVAIDSTKTYRYSVWIKQTGNTNLITMTSDLDNSIEFVGSEKPLSPVMFDLRLPEKDKWYLAVGYVVGEGAAFYPHNSGIYDSKTGERIPLDNSFEMNIYKNNYDSKYQSMRVYMYGSKNYEDKTIFASPRIDLVSGEEVNIDNLLGKLSDMKWIYEWNGTKTEINGSSVLTPKLFTGSISDTDKKATGIAMGTNVIDKDSGIVGYSDGIKTFHIKTDGSALFGKDEKNQIKIGTDGTLTLPTIKGDNIEANNLKVLHINQETKEKITTLEITDDGQIIMRPTVFELIGEQTFESELEKLGFSFKKHSFDIVASNITTGTLKANLLDFKELIIKNNEDKETLHIDKDGNISMSPISFDLNVDVKNGEDGSTTEMPLEDALSPDNIINMINNAGVKIKAKHINLNGYVTFTNINGEDTYEDENGNTQIVTVIDGGTVKTGTLFVDRLRPLHYWNKSISFFNKIYSQAVDMEVDASLELTKGGPYDETPGFRFKLNDQNYIGVMYDESYDVGQIKFFTSPEGKSHDSDNRMTISEDSVKVLTDLLSVDNAHSIGRSYLTSDGRVVSNYFYEVIGLHVRSKTRVTKFDGTQYTRTLNEDNIMDEFNYFKNFRTNIEDEINKNKSEKESESISLLAENTTENTITQKEESIFTESEDKTIFMDTTMMTEKQAYCLEVVTNRIESLDATCGFLNQEKNKLKTEIRELKKQIEELKQNNVIQQ